MPKMFVNIYNCFIAGNIKEAQQYQYKINKVINLILKNGVLSSVRDIMEMLGYDVGYCTYPMKRLTREEQVNFRKQLKSLRFEEEYV
jgi:Dihydrodipicolinate synthase/N-acetylneuraminate lyase